MEETELRLSRETAERLQTSGSQRFRRALKQNYTFTRLALPPEDKPLPPMYDVALSRDRQTLYINPSQLTHLLAVGTASCAMGEKTLVKFILDDYVEPDSDDTIHFETITDVE